LYHKAVLLQIIYIVETSGRRIWPILTTWRKAQPGAVENPAAEKNPVTADCRLHLLGVFAVSATLEKIPNSIVLRLKRGEKIHCTQDDDTVYRVHDGVMGFSVRSTDGHEALLSLLGAGNYFGDRRLAGLRTRKASATALTPCTVMRIDRAALMVHLASDRSAMESYIAHLTERNLDYEADLCGHLFDNSEGRLLRLLLKLCRVGVMTGGTVEIPVKLTHDMMAQMVGTTRSRVTFFMNKFRSQGWVQYGRSLLIHVGNIPELPE
jgi:CRP/FNR family transcriptional regulator, cyclic AMP receptor protein